VHICLKTTGYSVQLYFETTWFLKLDMWHLYAAESGYDGSAVSSNYNSQPGHRGAGAYMTYGGSHENNRKFISA